MRIIRKCFAFIALIVIRIRKWCHTLQNEIYLMAKTLDNSESDQNDNESINIAHDASAHINYRDNQYSILLKSYVDNQVSENKQKLRFKRWFFGIVCFVFVLVAFLGAMSIYTIAKKDNIGWQDIGAAFAGLGSILGTIIILPGKIADNLFPASGGKQSTKLINLMQKYDVGRRFEDERNSIVDVEESEDDN